MATDYEKIRQDNIKEYGEGIRHLEFLGRLYSDKTHFIYELLQNAEDARATKASFVVEPNQLKFSHNGTERFQEKHIRGICGVAEGTKAEDETRIGKFGIGFKSVYAYTRVPRIHCAEEHFRIEHFVRPYQETVFTVNSPWTTVFIFPFDKDSGTKPEDAFREIGGRLACLNDQTLLFLNNLREIEWEISNGEKGSYQSESKLLSDHRRLTLKCKTNVKNHSPLTSESWILFSRQFVHEQETAPLAVEAAFRLEKDKNGNEFIQRVNEAPLVVYFPTIIKTGLGFLIQGPYRTTPARDNIRQDNPLNKTLIKETADLIVVALRTIKDLGLLTLEVLNALPIKSKIEANAYFQRPINVPPPEDVLFDPIAARVAKALKEEELLPAHPSGFVSGDRAVLAKMSGLRDFLESSHLQDLLGTANAMGWLAGAITSDRTPELRTFLIKIIKVAEITPEKLAEKITDEFLKKQSDEWFIKFYTFLFGQKTLWETAQGEYGPEGPLRYEKNIIRLQNESLVAPYRKDENPNAFLPPDSETEFPTVKREICADAKAKEFLIAIGLTLPDLVDEVVERVLPKYSAKAVQVSEQENLQDVVKIASAAKVDSKTKRNRLIGLLQKTAFLCCKNAGSGQLTYQRPSDIHFDSENVSLYFTGNPKAFFLSSQYQESHFEFLAELGVAKSIRGWSREPRHDGHVVVCAYRGNHQRGLSGFDPNLSVEGLEFAVLNPTLARSRYVWNSILIPLATKLRGEVESSSRQDFSGGRKRTTLSQACKLVTEHAWLPDRIGQWHRPPGFSVAELPDGFQESETLCRNLQMEIASTTQLAEETGIPKGYLEVIIKLHQTSPEILENFMQTISSVGNNTSKPSFPEQHVLNPERRGQKIRERSSDPSGRTYEVKGRSVRNSRPDFNPKTWLANQYSNEGGQMICQMCEMEMPFRKRDGNYYFEAVEAIPNLEVENHELYLALCPLCAAKYQEFVKQDEGVVAAFRQGILAARDTNIILLNIKQLPNTIRFVDAHLFDLKIFLDETS